MDKKVQAELLHHLKIIKGQAAGIIKAVEAETYCPDVLMQSAAIQQSLKSFDQTLLKNHLQTCVVEYVKKGRVKKMAKELLAIYRYTAK